VSAAGGTPQQIVEIGWSVQQSGVVAGCDENCGAARNAYDRENSEFDGGQTANADLVWIRWTVAMPI